MARLAPSAESNLNDVVVALELLHEDVAEMKDLLKTIVERTEVEEPVERSAPRRDRRAVMPE